LYFEGKVPLERYRCRWEDNIKTDFQQTEQEGVDRIHLDQDRDQWRAFVNTVMDLRVSKNVKFL
jgi:hypothetical protein